MAARILLCTVGTSLFIPNLERLKTDLLEGKLPPQRQALARAYQDKAWDNVAEELAPIHAAERVCGAEINSIWSLLGRGDVVADCGLYFLHSDTDDGRAIGAILERYYGARGHSPAKAVQIADLQDADPKRFRSKGLRQLARDICRILREHGTPYCAINATGGYKAQIAIAVLLGQALGVPVYYKHERFDEIIAFPPMPVSFDFGLWMRASGMLFDLDRNPEPAPADAYQEEWDERFESLVDRVPIDGRSYIELSPTGQVFHETFRERFRTARDQVLPPAIPATEKQAPRLEASGWPGEHPEVERFLRHVTDEVPFVRHCATFYFNPDLPGRTRFRVSAHGLEGVLSGDSYTVKFRIESSARTDEQRAAAAAALNEWLASSK